MISAQYRCDFSVNSRRMTQTVYDEHLKTAKSTNKYAKAIFLLFDGHEI